MKVKSVTISVANYFVPRIIIIRMTDYGFCKLPMNTHCNTARRNEIIRKKSRRILVLMISLEAKKKKFLRAEFRTETINNTFKIKIKKLGKGGLLNKDEICLGTEV